MIPQRETMEKREHLEYLSGQRDVSKKQTVELTTTVRLPHCVCIKVTKTVFKLMNNNSHCGILKCCFISLKHACFRLKLCGVTHSS